MVNPTFGEKKANTDYISRYGVYAVIPDAEQKQIVLVQAPNGAWFLPGGEIEAGENHQEALKRELIEELGFTAEIGTYYGQADEYFYSRHRDTYYYNPAYLYEATSFKEVQKTTRKTLIILPGSLLMRLWKISNVVVINGPSNLGKNSIRLTNTFRKSNSNHVSFALP